MASVRARNDFTRRRRLNKIDCLVCLLACWGGINVSLWWGGVWGVVWLDCETGRAGRHGGAPASPYVGASHAPDHDLA